MNIETDKQLKKHYDLLLVELGENHAAKIRVEKLLNRASSVQRDEVSLLTAQMDDAAELSNELAQALDSKIVEFAFEREIMRRTFADALRAVTEGRDDRQTNARSTIPAGLQ